MMMNRRILALAAFALLAAVGCSNRQERSPVAGLFAQVHASLTGTATPPPAIAAQDGFFVAFPDQVAAQTGPLIGAVLAARNAQVLLTPSGVNGRVATWLSPDRVSFSFIGGAMLVRTSGLGNDLHNAAFAELLTVMASGQAGTTQRQHVHLTRDFQQQIKTFSCDVTPMDRVDIRISQQRFATRRFEESCTDGTESFTNVYWLDAGRGIVVQSVQWIHPNTGYGYFQLINI